MGAATSIFTASDIEIQTKKYVQCIVVDSSFSSLEVLIDEYIHKVAPLVPNMAINYLKSISSDIIYEKAHFKIENVKPIENAKKCKNIPALFCHGINDELINNRHSQDLFKNYSGKKEIVLFNGNHNSKRPFHVIQLTTLFFYDYLNAEQYGNNSDTLTEIKEATEENYDTFSNESNLKVTGKFKNRLKSEKYFQVSYKYFKTLDKSNSEE